MTINLNDVYLGETTAEYDSQLSEHFVSTSDFDRLVLDEVDFILGEKGSGKSAMVHALTDQDFDIPVIRDVLIVPAVEAIDLDYMSGQIARVLEADVPERALIHLWKYLLIAQLANSTVHTFGHRAEIDRLKAELASSGMLDPVFETRPGFLSRLFARLAPSLEANVSFDGLGNPVLTGKIGVQSNSERIQPLSSASDDRKGTDATTLAGILRTLEEVLQSIGARAWSVIDRVDELLLFDDAGREALALRSLIRACHEISGGTPVIRVKTFLRRDSIRRASAEHRFVNASHLRSLRIVWQEQEVIGLIGSRLLRNARYAAEIGNHQSHLRAMRRLCGEYIDGFDALPWITIATCDATAEPNPRNILALLKSAVAEERRVGAAESQNHLLSARSLKVALTEVSQLRLEDTLFAEFPRVRSIMNDMRGFTSFTIEEAARGLSVDQSVVASWVDELFQASALSRLGSQLTIAPIYRHALERARLDTLPQFRRPTGAASGQSIPAIDVPLRPYSEQKRTSRGRGRPTRTRSELSQPAPTDDKFIEVGQVSEPPPPRDPVGPGETIAVASAPYLLSNGGGDRSPRSGATPGSAKMREVRAFMAEGDLDSAWQLVSQMDGHHIAVKVALIDIAVATVDPSRMEAAKRSIAHLRLNRNSESALISRALSVAVAGDDYALFNSAMGCVHRGNIDEVQAGVVRSLDIAAEREITCWSQGIPWAQGSALATSRLATRWDQIAASRMLAIQRKAHTGRGDFETMPSIAEIRGMLWTRPDRLRRATPKIDGLVKAYADQPMRVERAWLPYQVLSLVAFVEAWRPIDTEMWGRLVVNLCSDVDGQTPGRQKAFYQWHGYSNLAQAVVDKLGLHAAPDVQ